MARMSAIDVSSREDFVRFTRELSEATRTADVTLTNTEVFRYLEALSAWTRSMDGYFANTGEPVPEPSWALFAMILDAALTYE